MPSCHMAAAIHDKQKCLPTFAHILELACFHGILGGTLMTLCLCNNSHCYYNERRSFYLN